MNHQPHRIPSLDGLRAISIALVLISHLGGTGNFPIPERVTNFFELGHLGVRVFFVISGFLITNLLLNELAKKQSINLWKFYFRRTFRIFPPYYAFVIVLVIIQMLGWIQLAPYDVVHTLTYTSNYYPERSWYVGHTWSLSVEEQFYLLWPAVLLLAGRRWGLWGAAAFVIVSPLIRLAIYYLLGTRYEVGHTFETVADSIAVGCVMAGARGWLKQQQFYQRLLVSRWFILIPVIVLLTSALYQRPRLYIFFGFTIMNIGIGLCIDRCVTNGEGDWLGRLLNSRPLVFMGIMSYSIYLWQQPFLNKSSAALIAQFPLNIILVGGVSLASYYLVERPCLRARNRLETKLFHTSTTPIKQPVPSPS